MANRSSLIFVATEGDCDKLIPAVRNCMMANINGSVGSSA